MTNDELVAAMTLNMERRNLRPRSIEKREMILRSFMRWLGNTPITEATRQQVELYLDSRRTRTGGKIQGRSRYTLQVNLHAFYKWAMAEDLIETDPTEKIDRPKIEKGLPRPGATDDLRRLLEVAGPVERCWLLLAALQGLRCQEIAGIRREDVIESKRLLMVTEGKGGKERMMAMHPDVLAALIAMPMPEVGRIFTRERGGAYSPNWLSACFNRWMRANGVQTKAHQWRHWFGSEIYNSTHDIRVTQELMGHSSPTTTAIYTAFSHQEAGTAVRGLTYAAEVDPPEEAA